MLLVRISTLSTFINLVLRLEKTVSLNEWRLQHSSTAPFTLSSDKFHSHAEKAKQRFMQTNKVSKSTLVCTYDPQ